MILSGGGAKNIMLLRMLEAELRPLGIRLRLSDEFGLPASAKEAVAFALLAHETWNRRAFESSVSYRSESPGSARENLLSLRLDGRPFDTYAGLYRDAPRNQRRRK